MKLRKLTGSDGKPLIEGKWALLGGKLAKGDLTATYPDDEGKYMVVISPLGKPPFNIHGVFLVKKDGDMLSKVKLGLEAESQGVTSLKYAGEWDQSDSEAEYTSDFHSEFEVSSQSRLYKYICKFGQLSGVGCFNSRMMKVNIKADKINNNFIFKVDNKKDGQDSMLIDLNMIDAPYKIELMSPMLKEPLGNDVFLITLTPNTGHLQIDCNYQNMVVNFRYPEPWAWPGSNDIRFDMYLDGEEQFTYKQEVKIKDVSKFLFSLYKCVNNLINDVFRRVVSIF